MMTILIAVLGFVTIAGLGFAFAGSGNSNAKTVKRAQAIVSGGSSGDKRAKTQRSAVTTQEVRRKQILKNLKDEEKQQKAKTVTLSARLQQAGLGLSVRNFWIISGSLGFTIASIGVLLVHGKPWIGLGLGIAAGLGLPRAGRQAG